MTIRLAAVAIGVRKAPAAAMVSDIITGRAEIPISAAAERAMGIMISAVAVFEMSWPKTAVIAKRPPSRACGPASPTTSTSPPAIAFAAPDLSTATDSGIMAATITTMVQFTA